MNPDKIAAFLGASSAAGAKGDRKEASLAPEGPAALLVNCICRGRCWCCRLCTSLLHLPTKAGSTPQEEQGCSLSTSSIHTPTSTRLRSSMNKFLTLLVVSYGSQHLLDECFSFTTAAPPHHELRLQPAPTLSVYSYSFL